MRKIFISAGVFALLLVPLVGFAADSFLGPIVSEEIYQRGPYLRACDLATLFNDILRFAVGFTVFVATLMFAYAGFLYVTASANANNIKEATKIFSNVAFGLFWVLVAWLVVSIIMNVLSNQSVFRSPWNEIQCIEYPDAPPKQDVSNDDPVAAWAGQNQGCDSCTNILGVPTKGGIGGQVNAELKEELLKMGMDEYGMRVTEAYPPQYTHKNTCHYNGTCVDAGFEAGDRSAANIKKAMDSAGGTKLKLVYEVKTEARRSELIRQGVPEGQVKVITEISDEHFSVYCESCGG